LEDQSRAIEHQLSENHAAMAETQNNLVELESQRTNLDNQRALLHAILDRIPGVEESFKQKTMEIDQLACDVVAKKNVAEPIWKRITRLKDTATTMTRHAALQKEYADAMIDMCALGCIDKRRARVIDRILPEVSGYPAVLESESLKSKLEEVSDKRWEILSRDTVD
jgi:chromosome segregation ATPase